MSALSGPDAALWRSSPYRYSGGLYIDKPEVIFKARVNQADFEYPLAQVTFDTVTVGAYTDVLPGFTALFGSSDGAADLGVQRVRKAATSTILYIGESSQGNHEGEVDLADNIYITVLNERRIWTIPPRYDQDSETAYKDYDIEVITGGRNYSSRPGPKANGGPWRVAEVDPITVVATFTFSDESIYVSPGSSFASRLWDEADGAIVSGSSTSSSVTIEFPPGRRYVSLTVTDNYGHSHTHYILVVVLDEDDPDWRPIRQFKIDRRNTANGAELTLVVHEDIPFTTYYEGAAVLYYEREIYGTTVGSLAGPATVEHVKAMCWMDIESESPTATFQGIERGTELRCISTAERLRQLNLLPQLLKSKTSPDEWDELASLTNARACLYLLRWHSTVLDLMPFYLSPYGFDSLIARWATPASVLWDQAAEAARSRAAQLTCDAYGMLRMVHASLMLPAGERPSTVTVALTDADLMGIELERNPHPSAYWMDASAITIGSDTGEISALFARAPGDAPGQGAQRPTLAGLIVDGQDELNMWAGNEYARINNPWLPVRLKMKYTGDAGVDPALGEWITLTLPASTNRRARGFTALRLLPTEVSIHHNDDVARTKDVEIVAIVETEGAPAATVSIPNGGGNITIYGTVNSAVIAGTPTVAPSGGTGGYQLYKGIKTMAMISSGGYLLLTGNFESASPDWESVALGLTGGIENFVVDAFSPLYLGTGVHVNGWIHTKFHIYYVEDIFDRGTGRTITTQHSFGVQDVGGVAIDSPFFAQGYIAIADYISGSEVVTHSEDNGATWNTDTVGAATPFVAGPPDIHYSTRVPGLAYTMGANSSNLNDLYRSLDYCSTWTRITTLASNGEMPLIHVPWHDNADGGLVYFSLANRAAFVHQYWNLYRLRVGGSPENITPVGPNGIGVDGQCMPYGKWSLTSHVSDRRRMAMVANSILVGANYLFTTLDGGDNWAPKGSSANLYTHCFIAGDDGNVLYLWGYSGFVDNWIGYSQDFGSTIESKNGNIPADFPTIGSIVGICGG